jgi:hypothetical protein
MSVHSANPEAGDTAEINQDERIMFIKRCDKIDNRLGIILSKYKDHLSIEQGKILLDKKKYINSLKNIVNDLSFNNKLHFYELHKVLLEVYKDVKNQMNGFAKDDGSKNDLVNMLVHRMIYDTSKQALKAEGAVSVLELDEEGEAGRGQMLLEKYIIQVLKKHLDKEKCRIEKEINEKSDEIMRRLDLLEHSVSKLSSMESLYDKVHSKHSIQRKRIISLVEEPVKKYSAPLTKTNGANMVIVTD